MKIIIGFLFLLFTFSFLGQDSLSWTILKQYNIGEEEVWNVDLIGNVYLTNQKEIQKYDTTGKLMFKQSIKSMGKIADLESINTMKIVVFSEEQQSICFFDNTLSKSEECMDLANYNIVYSKLISVSGQPDKIWVMDQLNSKLHLLSLGKTMQSQEIVNTRGILELKNLLMMHEYNNQLLLLDYDKGLYFLDLYGSLVDFKPIKNITSAGVFNGKVLYLLDQKLFLISKDNKSIPIQVPIEGILHFEILNDYVFLRTKNALLKYKVNIN
jgi:hypothetical protein